MSQHDKDPESPATTSYAYDAMIGVWSMIDTVLGGTRALRQAGREYLPQHDEETDANYEDRLNSNVLFNVLELTLEHFVGRPFSDPVGLNEDVPDPIREAMKNIDLQGNDVTTFARNWFREGLAKGFAHVLVDMPSMRAEDRASRTLADDRAEGRRPYWLFIRPENLIYASYEVRQTPHGPQKRPTHVRIYETVVEQEGFAEVVKEQIRVLEPGYWAVYEKQEKGKGRKKTEWRKIDEGETDLDDIPLVTFYSTNPDSDLLAKPPLEDLAHLNLRWWQSNSDQINILTVARFPMLAVSGANDQSGSVMAIGPRQLLGTKDPQGKFYYVEHDGRAISAGREDLLDLEEQMANYGSIFLKRVPGNQVATARALDSAESTSPLQDMTVRFIDSMNTALDYTARWLGLEEGGTVNIPTDFGPEEELTVDLNTLLEARKSRDISREAFLDELKRRGMLADDYDPLLDLEQLYDEEDLLKVFQPLVPGTFDVEDPPKPDPSAIQGLRERVNERKRLKGRPVGNDSAGGGIESDDDNDDD